MSGVLEGMDGIAPADVAERWFARLMAPDCTLRDREQFEAWLGQSPENLLAFEEAKALWSGLDGLESDEVLAPHAADALAPAADPFMAQWARAAEGVARGRPAPRRHRRWLAMTASVATAAILAVVLWPSAPLQTPVVPYAATNTIESVRLSDGSLVRLDLDTSVASQLDDERRSVELQRGRAMFDVARDASRPFVVDAGVGTITALGTRFQVQRRGEHVSVTLLEGAVGISTAARSRAGDRMLRLVPGQTARYAPETVSWSVEVADAALTSWSEGFHVFGATPLGQAVADINRYSDVTLVLASPEMGSLPLSGSFKLGDGTAVAEALPYALPVKTEARDGKIVISRR